MIQSEMPLMVDCFEHGVAFIAFIVGKDFEPAHPTPRLSDGREWRSLLPWERARQLREQQYATRPKYWVARDWFRVVRPRLYAIAKEAAENEQVWFAFNGEVLRFAGPHASVIVPATGKSWPDRYAIKAVELAAVPMRVLADPVQVMVWEDRLAIGSRIWRLVGQEGTNASPD